MINCRIAIDIGASGGRHIAGWLEGDKLQLQEIYRFENGPAEKDGQLVWDVDKLFSHIKSGLKEAKKQGFMPESIAIDTWAVDFVLLDARDRRIGEAVSYRDRRTEGMDARLQKFISEKDLYARTGLQKQPFNTVYQLLALKTQGVLESADSLLMLPEYFAFLLTGVKMREYTNASTTGLMDAKKRDWDFDLIDRIGLPRRLFAPLHQAGETVGRLLPEIAGELGYDARVLLAPTHDTAAAVLAAPIEAGDAYLSSGTWSLLGLELPAPILTESSRRFNMTNEGGVFGTVRYLKNIMGLWMLQQLRKEMCPQLSYGELARLAEASDAYPGRVDALDPVFLAPPSMKDAIAAKLTEKGIPLPQSTGEWISCVCHSLADCYADTVRALEKLTGKSVNSLRIVGGGCQNDYLNRLTAKALGKKVTAGPVEATAIGNILSQMQLPGEEVRALVRRSFPFTEYE
ncbi:MAG: rhamnulokinase [Clostridia bacterium]|nr:rhamnulokinase [Clostridia bacterium]